MAHPLKSSAAAAHTSKMRKMTKDYGMAGGPAQYEVSPQERLKGEGPEDAVGFGADSSKVSARSDKAARRSTPANPIATYARGGKVKSRADGGDIVKFPISMAESDARRVSGMNSPKSDKEVAKPLLGPGAAKATGGGVIARARGGRTKGATHVNVIIAGPQGAVPDNGVGNAMSPQIAALAAGAHPPMPMPPPQPAGPPPMAGPPPGGPPMPMRAKGGRVSKMEDPDDEDTRDLVADTLREEGLIRKARGGGIHLTASAANGIGRLEKMGIKTRTRGSMIPKEV